MKSFTYVVSDKQGLHARNAIQLAKVTETFRCDVRLECGDRKGDGKNVMALMGMGIHQGEAVHVIVDGADEEQAYNHLEALVREIM